MFLSTPAKIFHATCFLSIVLAGCSLSRSNQNSTGTLASAPKSEFPFSIREPVVFQADIVVRTGETERKTFIARNGEMRRMDFDVGTDNHRAVLVTDKEYLLFFKRKIFEERPLTSNAAEVYEPLTAQMLSTRDYASFEQIERDGAVVQFRARINDSPNSEIVIFFDESMGLPVRQEFYGLQGDRRSLEYSVELRDFRTVSDTELFSIPKDFRRMSSRSK